MTKVHEMNELGQSVWYDNMRRALLDHGEMQQVIAAGVTGVTSNPTIFDKAITGSADYDDDMRQMATQSPGDIYEALAIADIQRTADLLRPVYEQSGGADGYVSLEVSPTLANDTAGTVAEVRRLFAALDRPNVMMKIPATPAGIPAIAESIGAGININVTLTFSLTQYEGVMGAYMQGLERLAANGGDVSKVASVASFFVSRVDGKVDTLLEQKGALDMQGKIAVANAKLAYARFKEVFASERWQELAAQGARVQRPLWASTSTKNPTYPDTLYVDTLIGPHTVNTMPPATLNAVLDHATPAVTIEEGVDEARALFTRLVDIGIDMDAVGRQLQEEGVASFAKSFESLLAGVEQKRQQLLAEEQRWHATLGTYEQRVETALLKLRDERVMQRIWAHDYTVWKPEPTEITNRLDWLHMPEVMPDHVEDITAFVERVRADGYTHVLLLGMGGSSLAPEAFRQVFGVKEGYLDLAVLDSTDPGAVLAHADRLDFAKTLFLVSTKSGGTVETLSFFKFFYNKAVDQLGEEEACKHFVAITDPGSGLVDTAKQYNFRHIFLNNPNIGGRYSALSHFGIVPAALLGIDIEQLLSRAQTMACNCEGCNCPVGGDNSGAWFGAVLGQLALAGRDKVTMFVSPPLAPFAAWAEQLVAESTGKEGKGILPVADERPATPAVYGNDRLFVYLRLQGDVTYDAAVQTLREAGQPVVQFHLHDVYDLSAEMFRWEVATAVASSFLDINPFDQPNVESAKVLARKMVAAYKEEGKLPQQTPALESDGIRVYGDVSASNVKQALDAFVAQGQAGDYIAIQAYIQPTEAADVALQHLRTSLRDQLRLATTVGFGPRFLHSTGQLHKGDGNNGLFLQFTADDPQDADIPDTAGEPASSMSFGVLKQSQALGDLQALVDNGRRVLRFHLGAGVEVSDAVKRLV